MADLMRYKWGITDDILVPVDTAQVIEIGDLIWLNTDDARPATAQSDQGTESANQIEFRTNFLGVAQQRSRDGDTDEIRVATKGVFKMDCASAQFEIGDMVGADENGTGDGLLDQTVVEVSATSEAIGQVAVREPANVTSVLIRIQSTIMSELTPLGDLVDLAAAIPDTNIVELTDNSGGVDPANDIIAVVTNIDALSDSTGGTVDDTVAADAARAVFSFPITLNDVSGAGDVVTDFVPGFAGTIDKIFWVQATPVTTGSKNMDLVVDIGAVEVTGGLVDLDLDAISLGAYVAGSAVSGTKTFTNVDTLSVRAEDVAQFTEGSGTLHIVCIPTDVNDNFKELTDQVITQRVANIAILAAIAQLAAKNEEVLDLLETTKIMAA